MLCILEWPTIGNFIGLYRVEFELETAGADCQTGRVAMFILISSFN